MDSDKTQSVPDYYKLFQIARDASQADLINAYRHAKLAYQPDSLAVYSLYSGEEIDAIIAEIEEGYRILSDPQKRREYDRRCGFDKRGEERGVTGAGRDRTGREAGQKKERSPRPFIGEPARLLSYCGGALKKFRQERGVTLEEIAENTRISKRYLMAIEEEDQSNFPEPVYLKGYLRQYCRELGIDPEQAVHMYLNRIESEP